MISRQPIKDRNYRIIGYIDTDSSSGDKTAYSFAGKIVGFYQKQFDRTITYTTEIVGFGDQLVSLLYIEDNKK